jgi:hypothetical protein
MINALPLLMASLRLTLLPGEFSTRTSRFGSESPTLMRARLEAWKLLVKVARDEVATRRRKIVVEVIV